MINPATGIAEAGEEVWKEVILRKGARSTKNEKWKGVIFLERNDGEAFIGRIGEFTIGIGRRVGGANGQSILNAKNDDFWMWRKDSNVLKYTMGEIEGLGMVDSLLRRRDSQGDEDEVIVLPCGTSLTDDKTGSDWKIREFSSEGSVI